MIKLLVHPLRIHDVLKRLVHRCRSRHRSLQKQVLGAPGKAAMIWCVGAASVGGCSSPLPRFDAMDDRATLMLMAERASRLTACRGECDVILTDTDGESVRLDAVLLAEPPERLRIRAWKFGSAVFDLTIDGDQAWMLDQGMRGRAPLPTQGVGQIARFLGPEVYRTATPIPERSSADVLVARSEPASPTSPLAVELEIDRGTLTLRRLMVVEHGAEATFEDYRMVQDLPWSHRIELHDLSGAAIIRFTDVQLQATLPAASFTPPTGATPVP